MTCDTSVSGYSLPSTKALVVRFNRFAQPITSYFIDSFVWNLPGEIVDPLWQPTLERKDGLFGLLWGQGNNAFHSNQRGVIWLVVEVDKSTLIDLGNEVKFPRCNVVYLGSRGGAYKCLRPYAPSSVDLKNGGPHGFAIAGAGQTASVGAFGIAAAGTGGTLQIQYLNNGVTETRSATVGGAGLLPDTFYELNNTGNFIKADWVNSLLPPLSF